MNYQTSKPGEAASIPELILLFSYSYHTDSQTAVEFLHIGDLQDLIEIAGRGDFPTGSPQRSIRVQYISPQILHVVILDTMNLAIIVYYILVFPFEIAQTHLQHHPVELCIIGLPILPIDLLEHTAEAVLVGCTHVGLSTKPLVKLLVLGLIDACIGGVAEDSGGFGVGRQLLIHNSLMQPITEVRTVDKLRHPD